MAHSYLMTSTDDEQAVDLLTGMSMIHSMVFLGFCPLGCGVGDVESDEVGGIELGYEYQPEHGRYHLDWSVKDIFSALT